MITPADLLPDLFLRAPFYSFGSYDPARLPEVLEDPYFRDSLFLASPAFFRVLARRGFSYDRLGEKERFTLFKYYNRMCFRPTPFGSFASFTLTGFNDARSVWLEPAASSTLHLLPDQFFSGMPALVRGEDPLLMVNPTLYRQGDELRFMQMNTDGEGKHRFLISSVEADAFTVRLLAFFKKGSISASRLLRLIESRSICSQAEALDYRAYLLEAQVLYTPAQGALIGRTNEEWDRLLARECHSRRKAAGGFAALPLDRLDARLKAALKVSEPDSDRQLFYAALERKAAMGGLNEADKKEITAALTAMQQLAQPFLNSSLQSFITAFGARYDRQQVPLLTALDPDAGIGYADFTEALDPGEGLLAGLHFPGSSVQAKQEWSAAHRLLMRLWQQNPQRAHREPVIIRTKDLAELPVAENKELPPTMAVMFRKTAGHLLIESASGVTGTSLIGRFSAFDERVQALCRKITAIEAEHNPDVLFADIGQPSGLHVDNINQRASVYPYELTLNVYSRTVKARQIGPGDLLVSVQNGELILESARLGKRVIPRLATAYNFRHHDLAVFRLLCDLQYQKVCPSISFSAEGYFPGLAFYPRFQFEHTVISPAKWKLKAADLNLLRNSVASSGLVSGVREFRQQFGLPQWIAVGETDQQLVFNLTEAEEQEFFLQFLKGRQELVITEYLLPDRSVRSGYKPYAGQFIGFLRNQNPVYKARNREELPERNTSSVKADPGKWISGKWIYYKLYCSERCANELLVSLVKPFINDHPDTIMKWFFIRYLDSGGSHLRFRFLALPGNTGQLITQLEERVIWATKNQLLKDYQSAVYRPESERYRICPMDIIESYFCAGSRILLEQLGNSEESDNWEYEAALSTADTLIRLFLEGAAEREAYARMISENFLAEFKVDKAFRVMLDSNYRKLKPQIGLLLPSEPVPGWFGSDKELSAVIGMIKNNIAGRSTGEKLNLLSDLVHMQLNRVFATRQRKQELVIHYYLYKHYSGERSRHKQGCLPGHILYCRNKQIETKGDDPG